MATLRFLLGDQLTRSISALADLDGSSDVILMAEVADETTYVPHHKQKIALVLSAMRHFAEALGQEGLNVDYIRLDDPANTGSLLTELQRAVDRHRPENVVMTEPGEWRLFEALQNVKTTIGVPLDIREDGRFLCNRDRFHQWASGRKSFRMEHFYREMRRETGTLMDGDEPTGGRWNFDAGNRKPLPANLAVPPRHRFTPDAITTSVIELVADRFPGHFGDLEDFGWPVTREEALVALQDFVDAGLPAFGDYQDAMKAGAPFLFHGLIAPALNLGLLTPFEVCAQAEAAYRADAAPLNAVEGFVRQVLGWREFVRGLYWYHMPDYAATNALAADQPLPEFYWTGDTRMNCIAQVVDQTRRYAYAHHIQRLMVIGNFALLAGLAPHAVEEWYLSVYADAYEWVELPNTHGMALFADGGVLASKPYAASGAYIDRMSDYCGACNYSVRKKEGSDACPFNRLYWAFLIRNAPRLSGNPRMAMPYRTLAKWGEERRRAILADAEDCLADLGLG